MFWLACKFDFCPILDIVGDTDKREKKPEIPSSKVGPAEGSETADNNENVEEKAECVLELQGVKSVKLKDEVSNKVRQ